MSIEAPATAGGSPQPKKKLNLRRPDVMASVAAQVVKHFRSELVERLRATGGHFSHGGLTIHLAKEFGFVTG